MGETAGPGGLSVEDWASISAARQSQQYRVFETDGGHRALNPGQRWETAFDGRAFTVTPDAGGWSWGLELSCYGWGPCVTEATSPRSLSSDGCRLAYEWDARLTEWYVNGLNGIEHGYAVLDRPQVAAGSLTLELSIRGGLRPVILNRGRDVAFEDELGSAVVRYSGLTVFDAGGCVLRAHFARVGADRLRLTIDDSRATYPLTIDPLAQQAYLKASNTGPSDFFGSAVAVSGATVVVSAPGEASNAQGPGGDQDHDGAPDSGAVYVFVRSGGVWSQQAYLKASNTDIGDQFGASVALSGDTIVVGAPGESSSSFRIDGDEADNSADRAGAAYVFVRSGTVWSQQAYLKPSNTDPGDEFGNSVGISGDTIVVGSPLEDSSANQVDGDGSNNVSALSGAAYVFARTGTVWSQGAYLKADNSNPGDRFGSTVSASGGIVLVGAPIERSNATGVNGDGLDNSAAAAGAAYVFLASGTDWSQEAYLKASNTNAGDAFGVAVAVSGDTAVVGAWREASGSTGVGGDQSDNGSLEAGAAYVFLRSGSGWIQDAYLKASNAGAGDGFGFAVAASGDSVVVGARYEASTAAGVGGDETDNGAWGTGAAYSFERTGSGWAQVEYLKASNPDFADFFGVAVAVSGEIIVIGAKDEDGFSTGVGGDQGNGNFQSGAAYVFRNGIGQTYCSSSINSTGDSARICALGSTSVAANDLSLHSEPVPDQPGVFFYGPQQISAPFGNGTLCISGQIGRLDVVNGVGNVLTYQLDNTNPPSAPTQITPGSTWNFQAWFRDPAAGGANFDLSDGLSLVFGP